MLLAVHRILDRYLVAECLPTLGLSLAVFTFVLLTHRLLKLSDLVVAKGVPVGEVAWVLVLGLPALVPLLLPVSLLLAVLLAVGRLSADSEIAAMRACGVGLAQNLRPVMALSTAVFAVTAAVSLWGQPAAARAFKQALYESVKNRIGVTTETGVFTEIARGVTVYAERIEPRTGALENLFVQLDQGDALGVWILARRGTLRDDGGALALDLQDGEMHQRSGPGKPYRRLTFDRYRLQVPLPATDWALDAEDRATGELAAAAWGPACDRDARLELHRRLALPAACLVFGLLGAALGLHHARGGRSRGFALCLVVLLAYYALLTAGRALGKKGALPPELAMWMPDLVLGALGLYAFARKNREAPLPMEDAAARFAAALGRRLTRRGRAP